MRVKEIAEILGCKVKGDGDLEIIGVNEIQNAKKGDLTFLSNPKYEKFLKTTKASAVITGKEYDLPLTQLICDEPYVAFAKALSLFYKENFPEDYISPETTVGKGTEIGKSVYIGDNVVVGENCRIGDRVKIFPGTFIGDGTVIGDDTVIFSNVSIYRQTVIGKRVRIHSGAVIGSDGFGYAFSKKEMRIYKVPQIGRVVIEDDVEIGANTTIDRGTIGETVIGSGTKIDNLVQIGHNVKVGKNCFIVSQVGISGSTVIGDNVTLAGQVGVAGHIKIGSNITVGAKAGVTKSIEKAGVYAGFPIKDYRVWRKTEALINRLPEIYEKIKKLLSKGE
ncbi:UDP-3-O-(3-hydroxymyristoyl)glucosamine N-acyltransferase [Desulfurobacterium atlanticum]|uniref:UDP-3-O-acylglucosamine N-acyltransferase n=1 Tax=Desulfurobacterium atlanticum TaxID=240169 RepID=A0A238XRW3_9BACT|nr:UDP-3-O-(3-hydroxymyristoyl)glucosamine N-acyltransferase [Desulfurobacterium atlanticum]SNR61251.1 UDP-3-O-[3-hydroxymyristoyl] glucosamine N-acyltransferase [Desulfurobacterium atlanticum]